MTLAATILALASTAALAGGPDTVRHCEDAATRAGVITELRAVNVSCDRATRVARAWYRTCRDSDCMVGRFRCRSREIAVEQMRIRCVNQAKPERRVRFEYGV
jgi:hypothetical protein